MYRRKGKGRKIVNWMTMLIIFSLDETVIGTNIRKGESSRAECRLLQMRIHESDKTLVVSRSGSSQMFSPFLWFTQAKKTVLLWHKKLPFSSVSKTCGLLFEWSGIDNIGQSKLQNTHNNTVFSFLCRILANGGFCYLCVRCCY